MKTLQAINPLESEAERKPELEQRLEQVKDEAVAAVLKQYAKLTPTYAGRLPNSDSEYPKRRISGLELRVLMPAQINIALQRIIQTAVRQKAENDITGLFLTRLIQDSYNQGNETFFLNTQHVQIDYLAHELNAEKLKLIVQGNLGSRGGWFSKGCSYFINGTVRDRLGMESANCSYVIEGNAREYCGEESKDCSYLIRGNIDHECGWSSEHCTYIIEGNGGGHLGHYSIDCSYNIKGNVGDKCGWGSKNCTYTIKGDVGNECGKDARGCTFKTSNRKTYRKMLKMVPKRKGNKVELIKDENTASD